MDRCLFSSRRSLEPTTLPLCPAWRSRASQRVPSEQTRYGSTRNKDQEGLYNQQSQVSASARGRLAYMLRSRCYASTTCPTLPKRTARIRQQGFRGTRYRDIARCHAFYCFDNVQKQLVSRS